MSSAGNLKRPRSPRETDSQELPEKRQAGGEDESGSNLLLRPSAIPAPKSSVGLFKQSALVAPDISTTLEKLKEKQDQERKGPLVLRDPATEYHPATDNGSKQLTVLSTAATSKPSSNGSVPTFGSKVALNNCTNAENGNSDGKNGEQPKNTNPFSKIAARATNGFGFGGVKNEPTESSSGNPFGRIAKSESTWVKPEQSVKSEPEAKTDEPVKTGETIDSKTEIITGEEEEKNVLQINAKLYQFEKETQSYSERGRGILRMNDRGEGIDFGSRLVFRTSGTQRVALNTKLWPAMNVEQVTQKSVRISAQDQTDSTGVGIFLLQSNLTDSKELFKAIDSRILQMKQNQKDREATTATTSS